jgi:hypothetical protein
MSGSLASFSGTEQRKAVAQDVAEHANESGQQHARKTAADARKTAEHARPEMGS